MSVFGSSSPDAAIEIAAEAVSVAAVGSRGGEPVVQAYAFESLPEGVVAPSLSPHNIVVRAAVTEALRSALETTNVNPGRVALVIPDTATRVSLVRFDRIPDRREDLDQLVRWQLRKAAPFPIEDAVISYSPGLRLPDGGGEFVVVMARKVVVREYETVCEELGLHAGLVDLSTLSVLNLFASSGPPEGDWLLVHVRPDYLSVAIMRGENLIFFRNLPEGDSEALIDVVHQTTMYYQDRLSGQGFARVLLGGTGANALEVARHNMEHRLGLEVERVDTARIAALADRISASADLVAKLAPAVGILLRSRRETVAA